MQLMSTILNKIIIQQTLKLKYMHKGEKDK